MYRFFDSEVENLARQWRATATLPLRMRRTGPSSESMDGAFEVAFPDGALAWAKPSPGRPAIVVAREKIASDLAFDLGLPVPPVVIKEPCATFPDLLAISLVALPSHRHWVGVGEQRHREGAAAALEALRVFWSWIGDTDHNNHPENLLFQVRNGEAQLAAIDHSCSLGHAPDSDPLVMTAALGYGSAHLAGAPAARADMIAKVCGLDTGTIDVLVRRVHCILTEEEQATVLRFLLTRQKALPDLLEP